MKAIKRTVVGLFGLSTYLLFRKQPQPHPDTPPYKILPKQPYAIHPNNHFLTKAPNNIGIIGSGVSGLCVAKELKQQGYSVEILEKNPGLGGVWFKNYSELGLQEPGFGYSFPDYPFTETKEFFPKLATVRDWLHQYSSDFGLDEVISYNSEVQKLSQEPDGTWLVQLTNGSQKRYDFLVLATGRFHTPYIPQFPNMEKFQGTLVHSSKVYDADSLFKGKKVVIIGASRSAHELGRLAYLNGKTVAMVFRGADYSFQLTMNASGILKYCLLRTKLTQECLPPWEVEDRPFFFTYLKPVCQLMPRLLFFLQRDLPEVLRADYSVMRSFPHRVINCDPVFVEGIKRQEVRAIKGVPSEFTDTGLIVNGEEIEADVVVFCTGFDQDWLGLERPTEFLYRNILIPTITNLAVIGHINTGGVPAMINLQAVWLTEMLRGAIVLPSVEGMLNHCEKRQKMFEQNFDNVPILGHSWSIADSIAKPLIRDMGLPMPRSERLIGQYFCGLRASDYKTIVTHRQ